MAESVHNIQKINIVDCISTFYLLYDIINTDTSKMNPLLKRKVNSLNSELRFYFDRFSAQLARRLFDYLAVACYGEARYAREQCKSGVFPIFVPQGYSRGDAIEYATKHDPFSYLEALELLFSKYKWDKAYGGKSWARVARLARKYGEISNIDFIDRVVNLTHNGGLVFDKNVLIAKQSASEYVAYSRILWIKEKASLAKAKYLTVRVHEFFEEFLWEYIKCGIVETEIKFTSIPNIEPVKWTQTNLDYTKLLIRSHKLSDTLLSSTYFLLGDIENILPEIADAAVNPDKTPEIIIDSKAFLYSLQHRMLNRIVNNHPSLEELKKKLNCISFTSYGDTETTTYISEITEEMYNEKTGKLPLPQEVLVNNHYFSLDKIKSIVRICVTSEESEGEYFHSIDKTKTSAILPNTELAVAADFSDLSLTFYNIDKSKIADLRVNHENTFVYPTTVVINCPYCNCVINTSIEKFNNLSKDDPILCRSCKKLFTKDSCYLHISCHGVTKEITPNNSPVSYFNNKPNFETKKSKVCVCTTCKTKFTIDTNFTIKSSTTQKTDKKLSNYSKNLVRQKQSNTILYLVCKDCKSYSIFHTKHKYAKQAIKTDISKLTCTNCGSTNSFELRTGKTIVHYECNTCGFFMPFSIEQENGIVVPQNTKILCSNCGSLTKGEHATTLPEATILLETSTNTNTISVYLAEDKREKKVANS